MIFQRAFSAFPGAWFLAMRLCYLARRSLSAGRHWERCGPYFAGQRSESITWYGILRNRSRCWRIAHGGHLDS
jgi:hypothetical protein